MTTINIPTMSEAIPQRTSLSEESPKAELRELLQKVHDSVSPVWPLKDFVAVNPFAGLTGQPFLKARRYLQLFSDCESLMPLSYYREQFEQKKLTVDHIESALSELAKDGVTVASLVSAEDIVDVLKVEGGESSALDSLSFDEDAAAPGRMELLSEVYDRHSRTNWTSTFLDEVSRFCSAHYDQGQAAWQSPWKTLPLYRAWRSAAEYDRRLEVRGLTGFRHFVSQLPDSADAAILVLLRELKVPEDQWESMLMCTAFSMPGWSAWVRYQTQQVEREGRQSDDFTGLLAIRLACDAALSQANSFTSCWTTGGADSATISADENHRDDSLVRYVLLRASEVAWRNDLITQFSDSIANDQEPDTLSIREFLQSDSAHHNRPSAQMVFCIDVRSERFRRHLESVSDRIETFGFAGFFGVPIEYAHLGEPCGSSHVPAPLTPQFQVREGLRETDASAEEKSINSRKLIRTARKSWKNFQTSASSCFGFVETAGVFSGLKLLLKSTKRKGSSGGHRHDGFSKKQRNLAAPMIDSAVDQGLTIEAQAELAAGILRGIGITETFARLVVLCGHGSQTENNPLQAGLDCGACCGHSGEPNARFAAAMLNQPAVREALIGHGITIPSDVHFLAALHNTTNDEISFFDVDTVPDSHSDELSQLMQNAKSASTQTRSERLLNLDAESVDDVFRRTADWSEVRPEWGLTGNAAFIVAPRTLTSSINLDGRAFLHSYDFQKDDDFQVLEQIMTAPMVVGHWINMQYYASTVDNRHFGSGSKTIHNVVGQFGILLGNGGDLTTGLPWQSLHNGTDLQHEPLRLQAVIAAPRSAIDDIVAKHSLLDDLLTNDWLTLIAFDDGVAWRYSSMGDWQPATTAKQSAEMRPV